MSVLCLLIGAVRQVSIARASDAQLDFVFQLMDVEVPQTNTAFVDVLVSHNLTVGNRVWVSCMSMMLSFY